MAAFPEPSTILTDINANNFERLVRCLQKDDAWKVVARFLPIFNENKISSLSATVCPAESLLNTLGTRKCTIKNLAIILRECALDDAFLVISKPEQMEVIRQPTTSLGENNEKLTIRIGSLLELEFKVSGVPAPKFQWFKDDEILIDQTRNVLRYENFSPDMEGEYFCCASQVINNSLPSTITMNSDVIEVEALPLACVVSKKPDEFVYLCEGSPISLKVEVFGHPKPTYEWLHENSVLQNETMDLLFIKHATKKNSGRYRCFASNTVSSVEIITNIIVYEQNTSVIHKEPVSNKVALLIANEVYDNLDNLSTPSNDMCTIAQILQTFGFKIMCLQNLNLEEMEIAVGIFARTVKEGSFAFFYYSGHGFELTDKFLLPVNSPEAKRYRKSDALAESKILQKILNEYPALFVFLLDMCLKVPNREENPTIYEETFHPYTYEPKIHLIRGYSTTSNLSAYEKRGNTNGIYVNSLKKYLNKDFPILAILNKVNIEVSSTYSNQMPSISYNSAKDFFLNIPVTGFSDENMVYSFLNINEDKTCINGRTITLCMHKHVIHNTIDIIIPNTETTKCYYDPSKLIIEEVSSLPDEHYTTLQIFNLQRLQDPNLNIKLTIDNTDFFISKQLQITKLFHSFKITK